MHIAAAALAAYLTGAFVLGFIGHAVVTAQAPPPPTAVYDTLPINDVHPRHHRHHISG